MYSIIGFDTLNAITCVLNNVDTDNLKGEFMRVKRIRPDTKDQILVNGISDGEIYKARRLRLTEDRYVFKDEVERRGIKLNR